MQTPLGLNARGNTKPRRPFSPPPKHLALPKPLGQAAQPSQRSHLSRGNDRSRLTAPQPQPAPAWFSKSIALPPAPPPNLLATAHPTIFAIPKSLLLATSASSLRLQRASFLCPCPTMASAARRHRPTTTAGDATSPNQPPRLAHGEAVSAARRVSPRNCHFSVIAIPLLELPCL